MPAASDRPPFVLRQVGLAHLFSLGLLEFMQLYWTALAALGVKPYSW